MKLKNARVSSAVPAARSLGTEPARPTSGSAAFPSLRHPRPPSPAPAENTFAQHSHSHWPNNESATTVHVTMKNNSFTWPGNIKITDIVFVDNTSRIARAVNIIFAVSSILSVRYSAVTYKILQTICHFVNLGCHRKNDSLSSLKIASLFR